MTLFIKQGCPWCDDAEDWLSRRGVACKVFDVLSDSAAFTLMRKLSGQTKAPVLVTEEGRVLSDFGAEELPAFLGI